MYLFCLNILLNLFNLIFLTDFFFFLLLTYIFINKSERKSEKILENRACTLSIKFEDREGEAG